MKAYSHDLRECLLVACLLPRVRLRSVAAQFQLSVSFLGKLLHHRCSGSVAALLRRGGAAPRLDADGYETLWAFLVVRRHCAGSCAETRWSGTAKKACAPRVTSRGWSPCGACLWEAVQQEDVTCLVFVDETSTNLICCRRHGCAPDE